MCTVQFHLSTDAVPVQEVCTVQFHLLTDAMPVQKVCTVFVNRCHAGSKSVYCIYQ